MKNIILLLAAFFMSVSVFAQTASIKGHISDTSTNENLEHAAVSLLRSKDSVLYKFTRTDKNGNFSIQNMTEGKYLIYLTYPGYADFMDTVELLDDKTIDLGSFAMLTREHLLQEVVINQQGAIRIKGDTTEFKADSFSVRQGATVEELLKKLPSIQVDKDGNITAMGESVKKVLVDGEEFFGNDPTVATKNLQADAIDKVQVFDKKSDQAVFTGIDDGDKTKTINLVLKEDKKKGYFGKLELGAGPDDKWNNSAMFNNFKSKKKISLYGIMSSTGKTGLNWDERSQYGGEDNTMISGDMNGMMFIASSGDDFSSSNFYGEGLPKSWAGGINFSNKYNGDRQSLFGSYLYNKINTEGSGSSISQSLIPGNVFTTNEVGNNITSKDRHALNANYEWQFDSLTSMKMTANGTSGINSGSSVYNSTTINNAGIVANTNQRTSSYTGNNNNIKSSILLRKKFAKQGRTLSFNFDMQYGTSNTDGFLYSLIDSLTQSGGYQKGITDQKKINDSRSSSLNGKLVYTTPISKTVFLSLNYALRNSTNNSEKLSYDKDSSGKYSQLNDTFSNHYNFDVLTNTAGAGFNYNSRKITAFIGTDVARSNFVQTDEMLHQVIKRDYTNFFPRANFNYKLNNSTRFSINYYGNTTQPSIQQIQPIQDNTNPLNITIGNPLLKQAFTHSIRFNANSYQVFSQRGFFMYGGFSTTENAIVNSSVVDYSSGKTINQYVNSNGNYNYNSSLNYNMNIKKWDMYLSAGLDINGGSNNNFINQEKNKTTNQNYSFNIRLNKSKEKKYSFYYDVSINYNQSKSSINTSVQTNYWSNNHYLSLNIILPKRFEFNTNVNATFRQKTDLFTKNNNIIQWDAYIGKKIFKDDKGLIKLSAFDILDQNKGYDRYISSSVIQETNYQTINRYFMLSFVWNISKNAATTNNDK